MNRTVFLMTIIWALPIFALAQGNPRGTAKETIAGKVVSVEYGRGWRSVQDDVGRRSTLGTVHGKVSAAWAMKRTVSFPPAVFLVTNH